MNPAVRNIYIRMLTKRTYYAGVDVTNFRARISFSRAILKTMVFKSRQ
jgi:hypothetical protein